ncbi:MAG: flagellar basal body P-ring protein FlgI [Tepidisphaeraceae bacterium]
MLESTATAARIGDITRLSADRENKLQAIGLVVGLKGTGDGGDFLPAIRPLAEMLGKFSNSSNISELTKVKNVALVSIEGVIPVNARAGDKFDVRVRSIGSSSSLKNGQLFICPMTGPIPGSDVFALASGPVILEDPTSTTVGVVRGGGVMEADLPVDMVEPGGRFTLVIDDPSATWATATAIAANINSEMDPTTDADHRAQVAVAIDPKNVVVTIPAAEREQPEVFIARVQRIQMTGAFLVAEARVTINDRTGTMIITGDVEISPAIITHKGLTISTRIPEPVPTAAMPVIKTKDTIAMDPQKIGGAKLQDLLDALDQLKVPVEDKISIVKLLHQTGKLHAKLIVE